VWTNGLAFQGDDMSIGDRTKVAQERALRVFFSYSDQDRLFAQEFSLLLEDRLRDLTIDFWGDRAINPGSQWAREIEEQIAQANVFILLMSSAFLDSEFLYYHEFPAIERHCRDANALLLPVILRPCEWWGFVGDYQACPVKNGRVRPIMEWRVPSEGFHRAAVQVKDAVFHHFSRSADKKRFMPARVTSSPPSYSLLPSGPHRLSFEDIDRAVDAVIARRTEKNGA